MTGAAAATAAGETVSNLKYNFRINGLVFLWGVNGLYYQSKLSKTKLVRAAVALKSKSTDEAKEEKNTVVEH